MANSGSSGTGSIPWHGNSPKLPPLGTVGPAFGHEPANSLHQLQCLQQGCDVTRRECADRSLVQTTGERRGGHLGADCCSRLAQRLARYHELSGTDKARIRASSVRIMSSAPVYQMLPISPRMTLVTGAWRSGWSSTSWRRVTQVSRSR